MNDKTSTERLPELTDAAVARIETAVFDDIAAERPRHCLLYTSDAADE